MSKPPIKALESIKNYCEKTQCRRCVFGSVDYWEVGERYIGCRLTETVPCDWKIPCDQEIGEKNERKQ